TDFPCIYGERVGLGRSYVHLDGKLDFDRWTEGVKRGRCYVGDGRSHLMDFAVGGQAVGVGDSELKLDKPGKVTVPAKVSALLESVGGKPIRASQKSADWCLKAIDVCWKEKSKAIRKAELADAEAAYDQARRAYRQILAESTAD